MNDKTLRYLRTHHAIKKNVEREVCIDVEEMANSLQLSPHALRVHLELMTIDDFGTYLDKNKTKFCTRGGIERATKKFKICKPE